MLRRFAQAVPNKSGVPLVERLRDPDSPELRIVVSDGETVYFTLGAARKKAKLFGGIPLQTVSQTEAGWSRPLEAVRPNASASAEPEEFGGLEGSQFVRMELSVNAVARALPLD